jgi:hypothetical protein
MVASGNASIANGGIRHERIVLAVSDSVLSFCSSRKYVDDPTNTVRLSLALVLEDD